MTEPIRETLLTAEQVAKYQATARTWSDANPFKARLLALKGGLHAPSRTADRRTEREQARVDHAREVAEAKSAGGCEF